MRTFTAYVEWDPETKLYVGMVPGIQGAHAAGGTTSNDDVVDAEFEEVKDDKK